MNAGSELSHAGRTAHTHDPDRFLTALFAPAERREALFLLIAFNHELVRALETSSVRTDAGPIAALIRLQWWREVVEGARRRHELAEPLGAALDDGRLDRAALLDIIDARESEAEGIAAVEEWRAAQLRGPGGVQVAFALALGISDGAMLARLRAVGAAYGAGAMHRYQDAIARAGRAPMQGAETIIIDAGRQWLAEAGRPKLGRRHVAAALPAVLARRDLSRPPHSAPRGLGDRLSLLSAWARGFP